MASSASRITTSRPAMASSRATASPTTPAPITTASTRSTSELPFEYQRPDAGKRRDARHGPRRAVEELAKQRAEERGEKEADGADQRRSRAGGVRKWRERKRGGARQDERRTEQKHGERADDREPMHRPGPRERGCGHAAQDDDDGAGAQQPGRSEAQHETARHPRAGDLAEHYAGEHPSKGRDRHAGVGEREGRARHPRQDAHLAAEEKKERRDEAPVAEDAGQRARDVARPRRAPLRRRRLAQPGQ